MKDPIKNGSQEEPRDGRDPLPADRANQRRLIRLSESGVRFPCGTSNIFVDEAVDLRRIEAGTALYPGCRIHGPKTLIRSGSKVGLQGVCILKDMVLDREVSLGSGSFEKSVLLKGVKLGSSIRVRENCLLEEGCELSFSVDVKETFLLSHVVLGSEINFCDLFMAGGTGRKDHSEVGSGVIHFNFTPFGKSGDKTTASLIGDVVNGVFYRSKRIFIGGHSSLVGPLKIGYGAVVAAGSRVTSDVKENTLCFGEGLKGGEVMDFDFLRYNSIRRKVKHNVEYIAQLAALWHWYDHARRLAENTVVGTALARIEEGIKTRIDRLDTLQSYMKESIARNRAMNENALVSQQETFLRTWPGFKEKLLGFKDVQGDRSARDGLKEKIENAAQRHDDFVSLIQQELDEEGWAQGVCWLKSIKDHLSEGSGELAPPRS
jgi:UDP-N-acetylglucosamine/UDP-N-acetylgalactosamine diphosphorylase